jgi:hypothetical protein
VFSIGHDETVLADLATDETRVASVVVRGSHEETPTARRMPTPTAVLDRRLAIARAIVRAHQIGASPERLRRLDAAYIATRMPLDDGETYDD